MAGLAFFYHLSSSDAKDSGRNIEGRNTAAPKADLYREVRAFSGWSEVDRQGRNGHPNHARLDGRAQI